MKKIIAILLFSVLFTVSGWSASECSTTLTKSLSDLDPIYTINTSTNQNGTRYYFNVSGPGTVKISVTTANNHLITYSKTVCPTNSGGSATQTFDIDSSDLDFDVMVYRGTNGNESYTLSVTFIPLKAVAEYRFDECSWNGLQGDVMDSSNNYDAQPINGANVNSVDKKLYSSADLSSSSKYIELPSSNYIPITSPWSLTSWVKFPLNPAGHQIISGYTYFILGSVQNGGDIGYFGRRTTTGAMVFGVYSRTGGSAEQSITTPSDGWHHVTLINNGSTTSYYLDGTFITSVNKSVTGNIQYIATSYDNPTGQNMGTLLDEFKIFNKALSPSEIWTLYSNEQNGKNYDSTTRANPHCPPAMTTCWVETFTDSSLAGKWNVSGTGYTPQVTNGRLRLTPNSGYIATLATLSGELPANDNFIEIEFDQFAYPNANGADGMTLTLSNASITPAAGASGGSLGYAQKIGVNGFAGGWLGFGMDEFGNFSKESEGRLGGPGLRKNAFAIRGSGIGTTGYAYLTGTSTLIPGIASNSNGHKYKLSIDTRFNQTWVKVDRQISSGGSFIELIPWYNATQSATAPQNFRLSLTGSTGGSTNIHEADNFNLKALSCGTIGVPVPVTNFSFDAWDSFRSISDRNISTKIVNKPFGLTIASLNETNDGYQDFNGSVCVQIVDENNVSVSSSWVETLPVFNNPDINSSSVSFTINKAVKKAIPMIAWKKNGVLNCSVSPLTGDDNRTLASDFFAIRPAYFSGNISGFQAGEQNSSSITTIDANGSTHTNALDYNTTVSTYRDIFIANQCESNTTSALIDNMSITFQNGKSTLVNAKFKDVGDFNTTLTDSSWTSNNPNDCISGSGSNIAINGLYGCNIEGNISISITPYELNTTLQSFMPSSTPPWLYLDSSRTQHIEINATIQAFGQDGTKSKNFSDGCSGSSVPLGYYFFPTTPPLSDMNLSLTSTTGSTSTIPNSNTTYSNVFNTQSFSIPNTSFKKGDANLSLEFNFIRPVTPLNPFDLNLTAIKTSYGSGVKDNNTSLDKNATFVYGRVHAYDMKTDDNSSVPNPVEIEIYGKNSSHDFLDNKPQNVLYWYRNTDHDNNLSGSILSGSSFPDNLDINTTKNQPNPYNGIHTLYITNDLGKTDKQKITLDIPSWLTITPDNNTFTYQYIPSSDNTDKLNDNTKGVNSGNFTGSDFEIQQSQQTTKKGIKVFR